MLDNTFVNIISRFGFERVLPEGLINYKKDILGGESYEIKE